MPESTMPTPTTLAELQALLPQSGGRVRLMLTPDLARQLLAHNHPAPWLVSTGPVASHAERQVRIRSAAHVARLAHAIASGQWNPDVLPPGSVHPAPCGPACSHQAIALTPTLQVGNGRHRLRAVDLADLPIPVDVETWQWSPRLGRSQPL